MIQLNPANFRVFSPDETVSNRWGAVFEVTDRCSTAEITAIDDHVAPNGRVMEMLSEHQCEGWLEGYLLTGRHGFFSCLPSVHPHRRFDVQPARQSWLNRTNGAWHRGIGVSFRGWPGTRTSTRWWKSLHHNAMPVHDVGHQAVQTGRLFTQ